MKRAAKVILSFVAFFAGLAVTAAIVDRTSAPRVVPEFSEKLADVAGKARDCDVVFLGSSRVRRQVAPQVFEEVLREMGIDVKCYNFGLDGLGYPEMLHVADEILAVKPPKLKYVFLELTRFAREFGPLNQPDSQRTIYWHTAGYTAMIARAIWEDPANLPAGERWSRIGERMEIFLRRACNVGRGAEILGVAARRPAFKKMGPNGDGFFPVNQTFPKSRLEEYQQQLAALPAVLKKPTAVEPLFAEATRQLMRKFRGAGVIPIFVTMPRIHPAAPWIPEVDESTGAPVWAFRFDDPEKHPELFDASAHYDPQHLNGDGAKIFTRKLAEQFAAKVKGRNGGEAPAF